MKNLWKSTSYKWKKGCKNGKMFEYYDEGKDVLHFGGVSSNC
jgi:hypothetical protein